MVIEVTAQDTTDAVTISAQTGVATLNRIANGTVTATGGAGEPGPAVDTLLTNVSTDQTARFIVTVAVDSDPSFSADYAFNTEFSQVWNDSNSQVDVDLTVNWDTDPGSGNDTTLAWEVIEV